MYLGLILRNGWQPDVFRQFPQCGMTYKPRRANGKSYCHSQVSDVLEIVCTYLFRGIKRQVFCSMDSLPMINVDGSRLENQSRDNRSILYIT